MPKVTLYHNPRCAKSRQGLKLLQEAGVEPEIVKYLETRPSADELDKLARKMKLEPLEFMRTQEKLFRELGLKKTDDRPRAEWLQIMADHPKLIERPIAVAGRKAALGRPPENVLGVL